MIKNVRMIPYNVPEIKQGISVPVIRSLIGSSVFEGKNIEYLEKEFAGYIGTKYAVCLPSGRYALYLAYKFFSCANKAVLMPSYTCIPAVDAARWALAKPHFLDIDLDSYNPAYDSSVDKIKGLSAISLSYLYGLVGDIEPFLNLSKKKGIPIIEDAAIALGSEYRGMKVGSIGDCGVFSLQSSKIITSWKGGIITTDNKKLYDFLLREKARLSRAKLSRLLFNISFSRMRALCSSPAAYHLTMYPLKRMLSFPSFSKAVERLISQNPVEAITGLSPEEMPMSERTAFTGLQAGIALRSMRDIDRLVDYRRRIAMIYSEELSKHGNVSVPAEPEECFFSYGRFPVRINGVDKLVVERFLAKKGVEIALNYPYIIPFTKYFKAEGHQEGDYPNALKASRETFLLPFHTFLKEKHARYVAKTVGEAAKRWER